MDAPPIQYVTTSDGFDIAYCTSGDGPDFVLMPEPFNHLHLMWASPTYRSLYEPLAGRFRLIQFDPRGWGLSSRGLPPGHTERSHVEDLEAIVRSLHLTKFILYGGYFFGTVAAEYAVRHPEQVVALILWNIDLGSPRPQDAILRDLSHDSWDLFLETYARTFNAYEDTTAALERLRAACDPRDFGAHPDSGWDIPATLRAITTPTLVVARRSPVLGLEEKGKQIAGLIPNSKLVLFDDIAGGRYTSDGSSPTLVAAVDNFLATLSGPKAVYSDAAQESIRSLSALSAREQEVLRLLAAGRSNQQIADNLVISLNTVRRHVSNVFDKTGVANRTEAALYARDHGLA